MRHMELNVTQLCPLKHHKQDFPTNVLPVCEAWRWCYLRSPIKVNSDLQQHVDDNKHWRIYPFPQQQRGLISILGRVCMYLVPALKALCFLKITAPLRGQTIRLHKLNGVFSHFHVTDLEPAEQLGWKPFIIARRWSRHSLFAHALTHTSGSTLWPGAAQR